ncbi:MAG: hypothetical protein SGPRY_012615, partial [Prymnesium sp.]
MSSPFPPRHSIDSRPPSQELLSGAKSAENCPPPTDPHSGSRQLLLREFIQLLICLAPLVHARPLQPPSPGEQVFPEQLRALLGQNVLPRACRQKPLNKKEEAAILAAAAEAEAKSPPKLQVDPSEPGSKSPAFLTKSTSCRLRLVYCSYAPLASLPSFRPHRDDATLTSKELLVVLRDAELLPVGCKLQAIRDFLLFPSSLVLPCKIHSPPSVPLQSCVPPSSSPVLARMQGAQMIPTCALQTLLVAILPELYTERLAATRPEDLGDLEDALAEVSWLLGSRGFTFSYISPSLVSAPCILCPLYSFISLAVCRCTFTRAALLYHRSFTFSLSRTLLLHMRLQASTQACSYELYRLHAQVMEIELIYHEFEEALLMFARYRLADEQFPWDPESR